MPEHNEIRIPFTVDDHRFEAVGFLRKGERSVSGHEMLERTKGENGGVLDDEDEVSFLWERRSQFPEQLLFRHRFLVTNRRRRISLRRHVACFGGNPIGEWGCAWFMLSGQWNWHCLVLRRCA